MILLDKPEGMTSFMAAAVLRRIYGTKRAGHTGTLDPMATGVLPIFLGRATRLCSIMLESDKSYIAGLRLGVTTDTDDITGTVLTKTAVNVTDQDFLKALEHFSGEYDQLPPMYSALKKDGERLYDLARQGIVVEREKRRVNIKENKLIERINATDFLIEVDCSKGTYIRSLVADIGQYLGCGGTLISLRRTKTAQFTIDSCTTLEEIKANPDKYLLSPDVAVSHLGEAKITENQAVRFKNGGELFLDRLFCDYKTDLVRVYCKNEFLGLGLVDKEANLLRVKFLTD